MEVGTVRRVDIEQKMRGAYLSYAMSVITARALPDVRDGLKPVQRRILYAMHDMGVPHDQPTRKSARIVGEVLGKYHPHGDVAVYDAMVRMAQDFTMRYMLVEGQGNFGSVDGDAAAAMRYTEVRLSAIGEELLADLDKNTVDFVPNFDSSLTEPTVLPARLPNLLLNGVGGIAVGMATNIPPHNLGEVTDAIVYLIEHYDGAEDVTVDDLMQFVHGPDFPTSATILGREEIRQAYATGRGRIVVRAQAHIDDLRGGHAAIIVTELPYQVNKAGLVERIAELTRDGRIEGIGDVRDESDRSGMRVVVELKRGVEANPILSQLLRLTPMQGTFGVNMLALVDGEPRVLSLKRILLHYIEHRHDVLVRRTQFELEKAQARAHILEGLLLALDHLDEVINIIRRSRTAETAQENLRAKFKLSELQARAILDIQLRRLVALERKKIEEEHHELLQRIAYLRRLLGSKATILALIKEDVLDLKQRYADARRTRIVEATESAEFHAEELLPDEDLVVLFSRKGNVRRLSVAAFQAGLADGDGLLGSSPDGDVLQAAFVTHSRESVLFLTDKGRAYQIPAHQIPDLVQQPRGLSAGNLVHLAADEQVVSVVHVEDLKAERFLALATRQGKVKRLTFEELGVLGSGGATVIGLEDGDTLGWTFVTRGHDELLLVTEQGRAIRFQEDTVRPQGRSASGMRGITLSAGDALAAADVVRPGGEVLTAMALGYAKRSLLEEYSVQGRGGVGVLMVDADKLADTGRVSGALIVLRDEAVALSSVRGVTTRLKVSAIPILPRASWGRLVSKSRRGAVVQLQDGDTLASLVCLGRQAQELPAGAEPKEPRTHTPLPAQAKPQPEAKRPAGAPSTESKPKRKGAAEPVTSNQQPETIPVPSRKPTEPPAATRPLPKARGRAGQASVEDKPKRTGAMKPETASPRPETVSVPKRKKIEPEAPNPKPETTPPPKRGKAAEPETPTPKPEAVPPMRTRRSTVTKPPQRGRRKRDEG